MVPLNTTISYADLSAGSGVGESVLRSIVRTAIASLGFLTELEPGQVGHSAVSAIYHRDKVTGDGERFIYNNLPISAIYLYESLKQDPSGQDENLSAFCSSHKDPQGNPENVWKYFKSHPEEGRHFMSAMKSVAAHPNRSAAHIVNSYDWSMLNGKLVVDVCLKGNFLQACFLLTVRSLSAEAQLAIYRQLLQNGILKLPSLARIFRKSSAALRMDHHFHSTSRWLSRAFSIHSQSPLTHTFSVQFSIRGRIGALSGYCRTSSHHSEMGLS